MPRRANSASRPTRCAASNFIKPKAMPYTTPTGKVYDSGDFAGTMARAQEIADWDGFNKRAARSPSAPASCAASALRPISRPAAITGRKPRRVHARPRRRRHRADRLAVDRAGPRHRLRAARRRAARPAAGARARRAGRHRSRSRPAPAPAARARSRSAASRSTAPRKTLAEQLKQLAADALEASAGDMEIADGAVRVAGTDRVDFVCRSRRASAGQARAAHAPRTTSAPSSRPIPNGTHIAEVEIDPETGATAIVELRRGRRFRRHAQSAAARRPGAWRRRAGHRPGADGGHGLRRGVRPIAQRQLHGLRACRAPPTRRTSCSRRATCRARPIRSASRARARPAPSVPARR